ncbi:MAG: hypothetical protein WAO35_20095, partial [Terriglobia bacterium]
MAIEAYIDDSGVKGTDPIFVLARFIGQTEQWAEFSTAWKQHIRGSPSIAYFKMAEAAKLGGEFRSWKHTDRDRKLRGCVEIIKRYAPQHAIYCTIDSDSFKKRESRSYVKPGPVSHPYLLGSYVVLTGVCYEVLDSSSHDQIEVRHPPQSGWLDEWGRLKGGHPLVQASRRSAPWSWIQNCPPLP